MFEGTAAYLLNRFLGKYIQNLDSSNLNVSIFSGKSASKLNMCCMSFLHHCSNVKETTFHLLKSFLCQTVAVKTYFQKHIFKANPLITY